MHLYLSSGNKVADSAYITSEGHTLFTVKTPWTMFGKNTIISQGENTIAKIRWKSSGSPKIKFGTQEFKANRFFRRGKSRGEQVFTSLDGNEYLWSKGRKGKLQLFRNNFFATPVATFHRKRSGLFRKKKRAFLEIFPPGQHMIDVIVTTFVFVETARQTSRKELKELELDMLDFGDWGGGDGGGDGGGGDGGGGGGGGDGGGGGGGGGGDGGGGGGSS